MSEGAHISTVSSDMVLNKVGLMRAFVEREDPNSKEVDDQTLGRFLRARDLDIEKASCMFLNYLKWRRAVVPNGFISLSEIPNEIKQNKLFVQGLDKKGRPIGLVFGARHFKSNINEFKRYLAFILDKLCARIPQGQEKFVFLVDLEGWGYSNCDIRGYMAGLQTLQDCYPERLGKLLLLHTPFIFSKAWKIVCPFIDKNTREKQTSSSTSHFLSISFSIVLHHLPMMEAMEVVVMVEEATIVVVMEIKGEVMVTVTVTVVVMVVMEVEVVVMEVVMEKAMTVVVMEIEVEVVDGDGSGGNGDGGGGDGVGGGGDGGDGNGGVGDGGGGDGRGREGATSGGDGEGSRWR